MRRVLEKKQEMLYYISKYKLLTLDSFNQFGGIYTVKKNKDSFVTSQDHAKEIFASHSVQHTPAQWAFRWLWNQPQVAVVLSGMNSDEMVADNIKTASETEIGKLTADDEAMLKRVVNAINSKMKVGCTGCEYCMPCPQRVNISGTFSAYNKHFSDGSLAGFKDYVKCTMKSAPASQCIGCGKCEKHCPQGIEIRKELKEAEKVLETTSYKAVYKLTSAFKKKR